MGLTGGVENAAGPMLLINLLTQSMATRMGLLTKHPAITAGIGTAAAAGLAAPKLEEEI